MDFFKARRLKKLLDDYRSTEVRENDPELLPEILRYEDFGLNIVVEFFQQKKLPAAKARYLIDKICKDDALELVIPLVGDPYDEVRSLAKDLIRQKWSQKASPLLVPYIESPDIYARNNAVELLCLLKDRRIEPELFTLFNKADTETRKCIIRILEQFQSSAGRKLIISALNDSAWQVKLAAVKSLAKMREPKSVDPLIEKLQEDDPQIRKFAIDALGMIGDQRATMPLMELLHDEDLLIRQKVTDALIEIADSSIVNDLINLLKDNDVNVRRCAVEILRNMKDPKTAVALMQAIKDSDWWVRQIATDSLTALKSGNIVKGFVGLTDDENENIRRCAVEFFIKVPSEEAREALEARLDDDDWWVRERALTALGRLKNPDLIPKLLSKLDDHQINKAIPAAIADTGGDKAIECLRDLLFRGDKRVRIESMRALVSLKCLDAVNDLQRCLSDQSEDVRLMALEALKELTGEVYEIPDRHQTGGTGGGVIFSSKSYTPGATVTEAIIVIDLCNSTDITSRYGDSFALGLMQELSDIVEPLANRERCQFSKGTGDGFLLTFPGAEQAVRFSVDVIAAVKKRNTSVEENKTINIRIAINFGEARIDKNGDRLGAAVSMAFRVEGVKASQIIAVEGSMDPELLPAENRILVTENLEKEAAAFDWLTLKLVGLFELKGITGLHRIFLLTPK